MSNTTPNKVQFITNQTETTELPSMPGSVVVYRKNIQMGERAEILRKYPKMQSQDSADLIEGSCEYIAKAIVSWNLVDEKWEDIPVSRKIVDMLPEKDIIHLQEKIIPKVEKKKE